MTLDQAEVKNLRNNGWRVQSGLYRTSFSGHPPRAGNVGGTQLAFVDEKHFRSHQQDPSRNPLSYPGPLGTSNGKKHNRVDPRIPWVERDFHLAFFAMDPLELQGCRKNSRLHRAFEVPPPGDLPHAVEMYLLSQ